MRTSETDARLEPAPHLALLAVQHADIAQHAPLRCGVVPQRGKVCVVRRERSEELARVGERGERRRDERLGGDGGVPVGEGGEGGEGREARGGGGGGGGGGEPREDGKLARYVGAGEIICGMGLLCAGRGVSCEAG